MRRLGASALIAMALVMLAAGCGSSDGSKGQVVATTSILAEITQRVAGPGVEVSQLIPDGASPHDFQLSAKERALLEDADLVIANGGGLEAGLSLDQLSDEPYELIDHAGPLIRSEPGGQSDPHVWMNPGRVAEALPSLAEALNQISPDGAAGFRARAASYADELESLGERMARILSVVPTENRELVTSHDSLAYFAQRFEFAVVATPFPASGPEAEVTAASIDEVESTIERTGVPAVFPEADSNTAILRGIAERTGVRLILGLRVESPGRGGYSTMLIDDARLIARGLSG
jgi:zinc/manganese transport system substrate-binding protein